MFTIRPFKKTDHDYEAYVAIKNVAWPDEPTTIDITKHNDADRNPKYFHHRFLVETDDKAVIGTSAAWENPWSYVPGKYGLDFTLHPSWEDPEIEARLYTHLLDVLNQQKRKPTILENQTREDKPDRMQFWESHGFTVVQRENVSHVDLQNYDYSPFSQAKAKVLQQGIALLTLPELQAREPNWLQKYYDLDVTASQDRDMPQIDELTPQPIEDFAKEFKHPCFLPEANFIAVDNGQWVGVSNLWKDAVRQDRLWVGFTGVLRSHRRRGIATALKLLTFEYAQTYGARYIETDNDENNPMYALNVKLGFTPKPAWLKYRKELKD